MSRSTAPFTEPTSETVAPFIRCGPISLATAPRGADRDADDDEVGAFDRRGVGLHHLIGKAQLGDALARRGRAGGDHDRARGALRARGARDRAADQAGADQRQPVVDRLFQLGHAGFPRNSASALTTSRLASSLPTVMRSAFGSL